jgi:hypothetical protein
VPDLKPFIDPLPNGNVLLNDTWVVPDENPSNLLNKLIYFLPIMELEYEYDDFEGLAIAAGLLLHPTGETKSGREAYERVGYAEISETGHLVVGDLQDEIDLAVRDFVSWPWEENLLNEILIV